MASLPVFLLINLLLYIPCMVNLHLCYCSCYS